MTHLTRYGRRLKMTLIAGMSAACFACIFAIPFAENKFNNKVGYYSIVFNGEEIGSANSRQEAEQAMAAARLKFSKEYDSVVYMDNNIDIVEEHKLVASRMSQDELETAIYSSLFNCVTDKENATAYTVRINDFTVTLASKDDVVELMEKVTDKYDTKKEFQVKLSSGDGSYGAYSVDVVQSELKNTDTDIVAAALNGQMASVATDSDTAKDGITGISFEQNVVVNETLAAGANIVSVQQAYDEITKEKEEKTMYVVEEGDCLSLIAGKCDIALNDLLALNEGLTEESLIIPGDELVVTVPKSEISVVVTQRMTYEEDYNAPVQYVDDNTAYRGTNTVISEGTTGHHKVTADVTFVNGVKTDVSYVNEEVMVESQPQVVSVGTLTPPTYLRPSIRMARLPLEEAGSSLASTRPKAPTLIITRTRTGTCSTAKRWPLPLSGTAIPIRMSSGCFPFAMSRVIGRLVKLLLLLRKNAKVPKIKTTGITVLRAMRVPSERIGLWNATATPV